MSRTAAWPICMCVHVFVCKRIIVRMFGNVSLFYINFFYSNAAVVVTDSIISLCLCLPLGLFFSHSSSSLSYVHVHV